MTRIEVRRVRQAVGILSAGLLLAIAGCGGDEREAALAEAGQAVEEALAQVEAARTAVADKRAEAEAARGELEQAMSELADAETQLATAKAKVDTKATDTIVFRAVQRRLLDEDALSDVAISARVQSGVVTLSGSVPDEELRDLALDVARGTPGVDRVDGQIKVNQPAVSTSK